jgi:hypothetical protein
MRERLRGGRNCLPRGVLNGFAITIRPSYLIKQPGLFPVLRRIFEGETPFVLMVSVTTDLKHHLVRGLERVKAPPGRLRRTNRSGGTVLKLL